MELNCRTVRNVILENGSAAPEESSLDFRSHLSACRECVALIKDVDWMRSGLKSLPEMRVPSMLQTRLRVLGSRESYRQRIRQDFGTWLRERVSRAKLFFDNLLKPFAVPAAGGVLASMLCFAIIVDTLHVVPDWHDDMPVGLFTEVAIDELSPFCFSGHDVMVQLTVDSRGNVTDYALPQGVNGSAEELQEIGNLVLYSTFTPATRFGQPISSKRLFYIRHISIRG
jgi:hypothetical protein